MDQPMEQPARQPTQDTKRPRLLMFYSETSGASRRLEGHLAQVLQRRHNHETFQLTRISVDHRPDLAERFQIDTVPTILIVDDRRVRQRLVFPKGPKQLEQALRSWLH